MRGFRDEESSGDRGGPGLAAQHRDLAEEVALLQLPDLDVLAVGGEGLVELQCIGIFHQLVAPVITCHPFRGIQRGAPEFLI